MKILSIVNEEYFKFRCLIVITILNFNQIIDRKYELLFNYGIKFQQLTNKSIFFFDKE